MVMCILPREFATNPFPLCTALAQQVFSEYLGNIKLLLVLQDFSDKYFGERVGRTKDVEDTTPPRAGEIFWDSRFQERTLPTHTCTFPKHVWLSVGFRSPLQVHVPALPLPGWATVGKSVIIWLYFLLLLPSVKGKGQQCPLTGCWD